MKKTYSLDYNFTQEDSIFLAGPTYRIVPNEVLPISWRKEAVDILEELDFKGEVLIPEFESGMLPDDFTLAKQVDWETIGLNRASIILFWINRKFENNLFALTTNIEFGIYLQSGKIVVGSPIDADKNEYLKEQCKRNNIKWHNTLTETIEETLGRI